MSSSLGRRSILTIRTPGALGLVLILLICEMGLRVSHSENEYQQGIDALHAGDETAALQNFQRAEQSHWDNAMFFAGASLALLGDAPSLRLPAHPWTAPPPIPPEQRSQVDRAIREIDKAIAISPQDAAFWLSKGWLELRIGNKTVASQALLTASHLDPSDAIIWVSLGLDYERDNDLASAVKAYVAAMAVFPRLVWSPFYLDFQRRHPGEAARTIELAIEQLSGRNSSSTTLALLAHLHNYQGKRSIAREEFLSALARAPNLSYAWSGLASTDRELGLYPDSQEDLTRSLELDPNNRVALKAMAVSLSRAGQADKAEQFLMRAEQTPLLSLHAQRVRRIYLVHELDADDVIPKGLLAYVNPQLSSLPE